MKNQILVSEKTTFRQWIIGKRWLDSPRGDLAEDIYNDPNFPNTYSYSEMLSYLRYRRSCKEAISTFKNAYKAFKSLKNVD